MPQRGIFTESGTFQHGYLYKQSKMIGLFRKRYIVMDGNKLYSYKSDEIFNQHQQQYTEVFDLNMYSKVQITVNKYYIKRFEFTIFSETGDSRRFRCNSEFELRSWVNTITHTHQRLRRNHLILHFAGVKPPETCITTTYSEHITSIITIQTTLTEKDTVSALKNVIRNTYHIPSHKDLLIIYSHTVISKHDDLTLQQLNVTTNSLLLLAINADKQIYNTPAPPSRAILGARAHISSVRSMTSSSTLTRNRGFMNLSQLIDASDTFTCTPRTNAEYNYSIPTVSSGADLTLEQEYWTHLESSQGFDIITREDHVLVHRMPCGHWMNRESLYEYIMSVFGENCRANLCVRCPHSMDDEKHCNRDWSCPRCTCYNPYDITRCEICRASKPGKSNLCGAKWDYVHIKKVLTDKTDMKDALDKLVNLELFHARNVIENECNAQRCMDCDTLYYRNSDDVMDRKELEEKSKTKCVMCAQSTFCWLCGAKWRKGHFCDSSFRLELVDILSKAMLKSIGDVIEVPSIRCCPNCCQLIKHSDACKHMKCKACKTDFCFICLEQKKNGHWQCGGHADVCAVAERQNADTLPMNKKVFKLF
eukprot:287748_1